MSSPVPASDEVVLQLATQADAPLLANLLELYIHDLSAIFAIEIHANGRFGYDKLDRYWSDPQNHHAFLIRHGESLAGFALATRGSPISDDPSVYDVAEFFVLRAHRRSNVGQKAAHLLWKKLPGRWTVRISQGNAGALPFWHSAIASAASGSIEQSERPNQRYPWRVYAFDVKG